MGIKKWLLRIGFGSPGQTARVITNGFLKYLAFNSSFNETYEKDAYLAVYNQRLTIQEKIGNKGCLLRHFSKGMVDIIEIADMPLFIFALETLESKQFRSEISNDNIDLVLEVIREEVAKIDDSLIKLDLYEYTNLSIDFLNKVLLSLKQRH